MVRQYICVVVAVLLSTALSFKQTSLPVAPEQQSSAVTEPANSSEIDGLAAKILERIRADKVTSVVVVGGGTRDSKVTELGVYLRDRLNEAFVRRAGGVRVVTGDEERVALKGFHVSEGMLYCNAAADWITARAHADGAVTIELSRVENGHATVAVQLFDSRAKTTYDKKTKTVMSSNKFESRLSLTDAEIRSAASEYRPPLNSPAGKARSDGIGMPKCLHCPRPNFSVAGKIPSLQGTVYIVLTVLKDGTTDDVLIIRPLGFGLDAPAIDAVLGWKFKPAVDKENHPVAAQVPVEISYQIYN